MYKIEIWRREYQVLVKDNVYNRDLETHLGTVALAKHSRNVHGTHKTHVSSSFKQILLCFAQSGGDDIAKHSKSTKIKPQKWRGT